MSNGPRARVAESVRINISRPRQRGTIVEDPAYYKIRNYLVNFLVNRTGDESEVGGAHFSVPKVVDPAAERADQRDTSEIDIAALQVATN